MKIINNSLEHSLSETEKGNLLWWELNPTPLICQMSAIDCYTTEDFPICLLSLIQVI